MLNTQNNSQEYEFRLTSIFRLIRALLGIIVPLSVVISIGVIVYASVSGSLSRSQVGYVLGYLIWIMLAVSLVLIIYFIRFKSLVFNSYSELKVVKRLGSDSSFRKEEIINFKVYRIALPSWALGLWSSKYDIALVNESDKEIRDLAKRINKENNWTNYIFLSRIKTTTGSFFFLMDINSIVKLEDMIASGKLDIPNYVRNKVKNKKKLQSLYWIILILAIAIICGSFYGILVLGSK